jgi:hypothetical protein
MKGKKRRAGGTARPAGGAGGPHGGGGRRADRLSPDDLTTRAMKGDEEAFLALVRFHSTFNPIPLSPELLHISGLDEETCKRLSGRLQRKEDRLLRPFPAIDMVFWGEDWVQEALDRFMWRKRGGKTYPNEAFLSRLWDASREGAALQLRIYRKTAVTPAAWVRVKYPHFANLGLTELQMLKIARAEGCGFGEKAFLLAVRRFRKG